MIFLCEGEKRASQTFAAFAGFPSTDGRGPMDGINVHVFRGYQVSMFTLELR